MRTCICAVVKNENKYIRDWIDHHLKLGISNFFIYDNNDNEKLEDVIKDYIDSGIVKVFNVRNIPMDLYQLGRWYTECYNNEGKDFDYFITIDIDEYIILEEYSNIQEFLTEYNYDVIVLSEMLMNDNDLLRYENIPVMERFTQSSESKFVVKSIQKTNLNIKPDVHYPSNTPVVDINKKKYTQGGKLVASKPIFKKVYIKHFYTKTIEEWVDKCERNKSLNLKDRYDLDNFFKYNKKTEEKLKIANEKYNNIWRSGIHRN